MCWAFTYCYQDVDAAVASARDAFEGWRNSAQSTRTEYLVKYRDALKIDLAWRRSLRVK